MTHRLMQHIRDVMRGSAPAGKLRSPHWHTVQTHFKILNPECAVCGTKKKVEVHHKKPFHLHPELELLFENLISLCRIHHQWWGHLGAWKSFNPVVVDDAATWCEKIQKRPVGGEAA